MSISWKTEWWFLLVGYQPHAGAAALPPTLPNGYWIWKISATFKIMGLELWQSPAYENLSNFAPLCSGGDFYSPLWRQSQLISMGYSESCISVTSKAFACHFSPRLPEPFCFLERWESTYLYSPFNVKTPRTLGDFLSHECVYINVFCIQQLLNFGICLLHSNGSIFYLDIMKITQEHLHDKDAANNCLVKSKWIQ